jgi:hypothetical protein
MNNTNTTVNSNNQQHQSSLSNKEDLFQLAAKAEKLLKEILQSNKSNEKPITIKQEPQQINIVPTQYLSNPQQQQQHQPPSISINQNFTTNNNQFYGIAPPVPRAAYQTTPILSQTPNGYTIIQSPSTTTQYIFQQQLPQHTNPHYFDPSFYAKNPPPAIIGVPSNHQLARNLSSDSIVLSQNHAPIGVSSNSAISQPPYYYPNPLYQANNPPQLPPYQTYLSIQRPYNSFINKPPYSYGINNENGFRKRKFGEINNNSNNHSYNLSKTSSCHHPSSSSSSSAYMKILKTNNDQDQTDKLTGIEKTSENNNNSNSNNISDTAVESSVLILNEEEDLNLMRERELKELKCKSVVEKMAVFLKYYQQFKDLYIQRVQTLECSDSLKLQFHSLIKYLNDYEGLLMELDMIITEHERSHCKNNHRKTKKFFNKTKAFIRYECNKRLQSNIFEYRRLINSQDRYAGMYDLLDMNSYLISLLPDIGVSIRRYINRCEKAKLEEQQEEEDDDNQSINSDNSNDSLDMNNENDEDDKEKSSDNPAGTSSTNHTYESFSQGIDQLNRYLLKRVEQEESLDELVKERIIKWINKRQSKYILIFSDVDKLLNQHKSGECYSKFHSYLLFNLGKLITVCDSYHQKLKELLYSTTIRRKKKRKKVKLLPESMADVFNEINGLKKMLEQAKLQIKKCNETNRNNINNNSASNNFTYNNDVLDESIEINSNEIAGNEDDTAD